MKKQLLAIALATSMALSFPVGNSVYEAAESEAVTEMEVVVETETADTESVSYENDYPGEEEYYDDSYSSGGGGQLKKYTQGSDPCLLFLIVKEKE